MRLQTLAVIFMTTLHAANLDYAAWPSLNLNVARASKQSQRDKQTDNDVNVDRWMHLGRKNEHEMRCGSSIGTNNRSVLAAFRDMPICSTRVRLMCARPRK